MAIPTPMNDEAALAAQQKVYEALNDLTATDISEMTAKARSAWVPIPFLNGDGLKRAPTQAEIIAGLESENTNLRQTIAELHARSIEWRYEAVFEQSRPLADLHAAILESAMVPFSVGMRAGIPDHDFVRAGFERDAAGGCWVVPAMMAKIRSDLAAAARPAETEDLGNIVQQTTGWNSLP